jgi:hypothetical protein
MSANINGPTTPIDPLYAAVLQEYGPGPHVFCKLTDNSGILVVVPMRGTGACNAIVYNLAGDVRCEIEIPIDFRSGLGFTDAYYVNNELTAIFVTAGRDFAFVIDERTGKVERVYETR